MSDVAEAIMAAGFDSLVREYEAANPPKS